MIKRLTHYGCSFAVGNGIPHFVPGLPSDVAPRIHKMGKDARDIAKEYNFIPQEPITCGKFLADKLGLAFKKVAQNGASNERIFRKVLETKLDNSFVLIGFTSYNRREGLTTTKNKSHWHTWKMIAPGEEAKYKDLIFKPWKDEYKPAIEEELQIRTVMQIIYMQSYLKNNNIDTIIDDTEENVSAKMKKFNLIGIPFQIILGNKTEGDLLEFKEIGKESVKIKLDKILEIINSKR